MKAYVFPGQGAQFTGMGLSLYENFPEAQEMFEKANQVLGFNITDIMFELFSSIFKHYIGNIES